MKNIIYHNPNWSKSRKSVEILENKNIDFDIIQYIKNPPSEKDLKKICLQLNCQPKDIISKGEKDYKENNISKFLDNTNLLITKMVQYPKIIERPIIIIGDKAVIGRPPENIYNLIKK